jgi:hypothetical protein
VANFAQLTKQPGKEGIVLGRENRTVWVNLDTVTWIIEAGSGTTLINFDQQNQLILDMPIDLVLTALARAGSKIDVVRHQQEDSE